MPSLAETFRADVETAMREAGVNRSELARRMKSYPSRISDLLNSNESPTLRTVERVARALRCEARVSLTRRVEGA